MEVIRASGADEVRIAQDEADRQRIWKGRKSAFSAVGRISPDYVVSDGVVPRSRLVAALGEIERLSRNYGIRVANVFHAGDGNLHPLILFDGREAGALERAEQLAGRSHHASATAARSLEHGVGMEKREYRPRCSTRQTCGDARRARDDPRELSNRGKTFPQERVPAPKSRARTAGGR
jgi:glycolate oxidase